jgi:hypothetical protein
MKMVTSLKLNTETPLCKSAVDELCKLEHVTHLSVYCDASLFDRRGTPAFANTIQALEIKIDTGDNMPELLRRETTWISSCTQLRDVSIAGDMDERLLCTLIRSCVSAENMEIIMFTLPECAFQELLLLNNLENVRLFAKVPDRFAQELSKKGVAF